MTRAPELAPSWLPRQQRRRINRQLHRLLRRDACSICGSALKHNSRTTSGLDAQGKVVLAGECCTSRVAVTFGRGLYSDRKYDFLLPRESKSNTEPVSNEQIIEAIATCQEVIAATDKRVDDIERCGGIKGTSKVNLLDSPWKADDSGWFAQNQDRAHRVRMPFPGEGDKEVAETPAGHALIILVRQVKPGTRIRAAVTLDVGFLPLPDDEATVHALFEVAMEHEAVPPDRQALCALAEKYKGRQGQ